VFFVPEKDLSADRGNHLSTSILGNFRGPSEPFISKYSRCRLLNSRQRSVSGLTAIGTHGHAQHSGVAAASAGFVLERIRAALETAGGSLADVVRTRISLRDSSDAHAVARVHRKFFDAVRPVSTLVCADPIDAGMLAQVEADAIM
jgi:enamine deaminase RidA (YjgF/YER057c/UK114 family)